MTPQGPILSQRQSSPDQYLKKIGHTWYVSVRVPRTLEKIAGNTHIRRSLQTRDRAEANRRKHALVGQIKAELERMRKVPSSSDAIPITFASARAFRADLIELEESGREDAKEAIEHLAIDTAEEIERLHGPEKAKRWYKAATRTADQLSELMVTQISRQNITPTTLV